MVDVAADDALQPARSQLKRPTKWVAVRGDRASDLTPRINRCRN